MLPVASINVPDMNSRLSVHEVDRIMSRADGNLSVQENLENPLPLSINMKMATGYDYLFIHLHVLPAVMGFW